MKWIFLWLAAGGIPAAVAQISPSLHLPAGAIQAYTDKPDAFSFLYNVAVLPLYKKGAAGVMSERRYMLPEGNLFSGSAVMVTRVGNVGINLNYEGYAVFKHYDIQVGYGRNLGMVQAGIRFRYAASQVREYGGSSAFSAGAGVRVQPVKRWVIGGEWMNFPTTGTKLHPQMARAYKAGIGFRISDSFLWLSEWMQEQGAAASIHSGIAYRHGEHFSANAGITTWNRTFYCAAGWQKKQLRLLISVSNHPYLGISPGVWIQNQWE